MIATGDLTGNRIAYKITISSQNASSPSKTSKREIYKPPEKRQRIIDELRLT